MSQSNARLIATCEGRREEAYKQYLKQRNISDEAAETFGLGYATNGEFASRITYPFYNISGQVVGFTGRLVNNTPDNGFTGTECKSAESGPDAGVQEGGNKPAESVQEGKSRLPKYKNSAESEIFHKDELLYGLWQAKRAIREEDRAYIVEGQNDVIRMWMSGHKNTVAGSGTAFSVAQCSLLQRFTRNVVLMYDGDAAGRKATLRTLRVLLERGMQVWVCRVPDGEDPDSWLQKAAADAGVLLTNHTQKWYDYLGKEVYPVSADADETLQHAQALADMIAVVPQRLVRQQLTMLAAMVYKTDREEMQRLVNSARMKQRKPGGQAGGQVNGIDEWQAGLYGLEEAREKKAASVRLTFSKDVFVEHWDDAEPWILWQGEDNVSQVQQLRDFGQLTVLETDLDSGSGLQVVRGLHRDGRHVLIEQRDGLPKSFTDWYIDRHADALNDERTDAGTRTQIVSELLDVVAETDAVEREVNGNEYRRRMQLTQSTYKTLLQQKLTEKKDRREAERKRLLQQERTNRFNWFDLPDYVEQNEVLKKQYEQYGFFPLLNTGNDEAESEEADEGAVRPVAYVFKNEKGEGHTIVSDFYMEALLFVDPATDHSKRVIRLNHLHGGSQYVEWPSDVFVSLTDVKKRLFQSGAYNFNGTPVQWDRIRQLLSYNFTDCYEARVYGWQPEGFLMLPNAVYYPVESGNRGTEESGNRGTGEWRLEYMDKLGVAEVNGMRFYSPASSSIRLTGRQEDNPYEQDELAFYLEGQGANRTDFRRWATLMSEVFSVNDNGKWAVMFAIACNFRDFIYSVVGNFTALCFAGPTGSGKTELAYGIRGLWMRRKASVFNLNSGTDAAFFMVLEHFRNMPVIMEEYNDNDISQQKFQGLKAAVYDDQGRVKVKDMASKSTDASKTNAAPILLGQDTPQQDDGSLSNRVIICEVPRKEGGFTPEETERFERLKRLSETGLGNVLCEIVRQRGVFERHYKTVYFEEVQRLKRDTWSSTTNKEGLERVIRSVAIMSATARLIEERGSISLPWRYSEFYALATQKIVHQMESISTTSKLGAFFAALNTLLTTGKVIYGRELKVAEMKEETLQVRDGAGVKRVEVGLGSKILYLHFDGCYSAYAKEVQKDSLTKQTLTNYFRSNTAYIGQVKSTRFQWMEADWGSGQEREDGGVYANRQMMQKGFVSSAYVFKYEPLQELYDVDYEWEPAKPETDAPAQAQPEEPLL